MPYINADGSVTPKRSNFRISIFSDIFWAVANFISLFFQTLINPKAPIKRKIKNEDKPFIPSRSNSANGKISNLLRLFDFYNFKYQRRNFKEKRS